MIDYGYKDLFLQDSIEKQITISYGNTVITNEDLFNQEMTLEESLCSEQQLIFGSCEASVIKFKVANIVEQMKGKWLDVKIILEGNESEPFLIGRYKVNSEKFTADRRWKEVVAYDAMYDIINSDVIGWYNSILPDAGSSMTLKQFRTSFLEHFDIGQEDVSLVNDNVVVRRTIGDKELSGAMVIEAICEMNGCFGHIGRDGVFRYIHLVQGMQGLYPRNDLYPADNIYPHDPKSTPIPRNIYISCTYEDFITDEIGKLQIVNGSTGIISSVGNGENCYVIESNFLLSDKTEGELNEIGKRILEKIRAISYRPFDAECLGNPCFEVGDPVRLSTTYEIVETYILKRTLKGIQALKDSYSSDGVKKYEIKVNSIDRAVGQLNDKTDSLEEDVGNINDDIDGINDEIEDINETTEKLHISLQKTEEGLEAEVSRATAAEGNLSSRITMTANDITAEVSRATAAEGNLSSRITINAEGISTKVTKGAVVSEINQTSDKIILSANRLVVNSTNFSLDANGNATFSGNLNGASGTFAGTLTSPTVNFYGLFSYNGKWQLDSVSNNALYVHGGHISVDGAGYIQAPEFISSGNIRAKGGINAYGVDTDYLTVNSNSYIASLSSPTITAMQAQINALISASDKRLKYGIKDIQEDFACRIIDGAMPKEYYMKEKSDNKKHFGMVAQDVKKQLSEIGISDSDLSVVNVLKDDGVIVPKGEKYYGISYIEYIPLLIKYCQMLKKEIKKLKEKIN